MGKNIMTFDAGDWSISYSADGTTFVEVDGITGFNINSDPGQVRAIRTLKGTTNVEQEPGPGQATLDIGNYLPHLRSWKDLRAYFTAGRTLTWRTSSKAAEELLGEDTNRTASIATTGIVTFGGSGVIDFKADYAKGSLWNWHR